MTDRTTLRLMSLMMLMLITGSSLILLSCPPTFARGETSPPSLRDVVGATPAQPPAGVLAPDQAGAMVMDDELGRSAPRSAVQGFLDAIQARRYDLAADYVNFEHLPPETAPDERPSLARQLKIVLDRALWIDLNQLSDKPEGVLEDQSPGKDRIGNIFAKGRTYSLFVERFQSSDGGLIWKLSGPAVDQIPQLYAEYGHTLLDRLLPPWLLDVSLFGTELWFWISLLIVAAASYPLAMLITRAMWALLRRVNTEFADEGRRCFSGPVTLLIWTAIVRYVGTLMGPSITMRAISQARTIQLIVLGWLLFRLIDFLTLRVSARLDRGGVAGAAVLLAPMANLIKLLTGTAALLLWLDNIGFKITTLLAGLSISGVAVALASQKTLENVFGAFTLFAAQPVRVGDFCAFGSRTGTVEQIGLRATKIRTLERSIITIANGEFANMHLENLSMRDTFWYHPKLSLRLETSADQIRFLVIELHRMLYAHPKVLPEPLHVRFVGFGEDSLDLDVFAYMAVKNYDESLEVAEDLNLRVMDIIASGGTQFAIPAAIEYQLPGSPLDEQRAEAVSAAVREWKSKRTFYMPRFPKEKIAEAKGSLDYPPIGSPDANARLKEAG